MIILLLAILVFLFQAKLSKLGLGGLVRFKWVIILLGVFAVYSGLIYNEFMALKFPFFGSCYKVEKARFVRASDQCVYPFGFDWVWAQASNEIQYFNSFRTKLSILLGVSQMTLGILLKGANFAYFGKWADFFFEFLPQVGFFCGLFGYLSILIIIKWKNEWSLSGKIPNLLSVLLGIAGVRTSLTQGTQRGDPHP